MTRIYSVKLKIGKYLLSCKTYLRTMAQKTNILILAKKALRNSEDNSLAKKALGQNEDKSSAKKAFAQGEDKALAEKALRQSETKFRGLVESSCDWVWELDVNGVYAYTSPQVEAILGYKPSEVIGKTPFELMPPGEAEQTWKNARNLIKTGLPIITFENVNLHKNGQRIILETSGVPFFDETGNIIGYRGVDRDITARKQAERKLVQEQRLSDYIVKSMPGLFYIFKENNTKFFRRNNNWETVTGLSKAELDKINVMNLFQKGAPREKAENTIKKVYKKGFASMENILVSKNGNKTPYFFTGLKLDIQGTNYIIGTGVDLSERKAMEEELIHSHKMESIGTLTGGIAHDFNNMLGIIVGNAELALGDTPEWNPVHTNLQEIKKACMKGANIVKQLLSFCRRTNQELKPIKISTIINDILILLRATIPSTIEIHKTILINDETILADPIKINQIMMNLCINASQEMEEAGGVLEIIAEKLILDDKAAIAYSDLSSGSYISITISDTGKGIEPEIINRIFDPYFTTKDVGKGSGMGLAVVYGIVKNYKGIVTINSQPGKGSVFKVLLPVAEEKSEIEETETKAETETETETINELPGGTETILFVDDEKSIVDKYGQLLERLGYIVKTKTNPIEGLKLFQSKPELFDLVITDMTMPDMTGARLSEKLIDIRHDIPIIICTGHNHYLDHEKAKEIGIAAYIMKPFILSSIAKTVRQVLDNKQ